MSFNKWVIVVLGMVLVSACSRYTSGTNSADGYGYSQPKSTDPSVYNAKPENPTPPPAITPDTVIVVVEPPAPPVPPQNNPTTNDEFAQPEPWMRPVPGAYLAVKMKKTPCYGTCPTYTAAIFSDGTVFYHGERFVENIGYFEGRVSTEQLNALIKMGYQNGFFDLANAYPLDGRYIPDLPTTILHLNSGINNKTITDRGNSPEELDVLQEATHVLLQSIQWLPIKK